MKRKLTLTIVLFVFVLTISIFVLVNYRKQALKEHNCANMSVIHDDLHNSSLAWNKEWPWLPTTGYCCDWNPDEEPPGELASSWRFGLSHWLGSGSADNDYFFMDQRWDSPTNIKAHNSIFCWEEKDGTPAYNWTNVMAIVGPDTGFELRTSDKLQGCEDLIICVEVADSGIHWGQPGDMHVDDFKEEHLHGVSGDGIIVLFLDGTVWFVKDTVPLETLKRFFTATGAREYDRETSLRQWAEEYKSGRPFSEM